MLIKTKSIIWPRLLILDIQDYSCIFSSKYFSVSSILLWSNDFEGAVQINYFGGGGNVSSIFNRMTSFAFPKAFVIAAATCTNDSSHESIGRVAKTVCLPECYIFLGFCRLTTVRN